MNLPDGWTAPVTPTGAEPLAPGDERRPATPQAQLDALRQLARDWRGGQLGILGLISIVTLIKGSTTIGELGGPAAAATGVLILVSLLTACYAVFALSSAAWGWPMLTAQPADRLYFDQQRLTAAIRRVRAGVAYTFVSVLLLAAALALTWYAPSSPSDLVRVQGPAGPICGHLLRAGARSVTLSVAGENVRIGWTRVAALRPVASC